MNAPSTTGDHPAPGPDPVRTLLLFVVVAAVAFAWLNRFVLDDAYISFRYARNLVEGHGLVWNPGEWVEGYTNFLWTLIMALPFYLGVDPVPFSQALGLACLAGSLLATHHLARSVLGSRRGSVVVVLLLGSCYSFSAFGTSGLETSLQTFLLVAAAAASAGGYVARTLTPRRAAAISLLLTAAVMTRLDSSVIGVWIGAGSLWMAWRWPSAAGRSRCLVALAAPFLVLVGSWLGWKLYAYGDILPNTYYAKVGGDARWGQGWSYLWAFASSYWLLPLALLLPLGFRRLAGPDHRLAATAVAVLTAWCVYIASVGGDFMEFRFMVPILPVLFVLIGWFCWCHIRRRVFRRMILGVVLLGSVSHQMRFRPTDGIESVAELAAHLHRPVQDWEGVGRRLGALFAPADQVLLATTAAGAIPYHSRLRTIDMLGLTDPWIARRGKAFGAQRGHERVAPVRYLVARGVHLVLGQPWLRRPSQEDIRHVPFSALREFRVFSGERARDFPPAASLLEIPLDRNRRLVALYLLPHPVVAEAIAQGRWRRFAIRAPGPDAML